MRVFLFLFLITACTQAVAESHVVVSVKPLHSLVAAVMEGEEPPLLLAGGSASPHAFQLKPSQVEALRRADVVFYLDDYFELFLRKILPALPEQVQRVKLSAVKGMTLYPSRSYPEMQDVHVWLMPQNAVAMTEEIARVLSARYPENAERYQANAAKLVKRLQALDADLQARLKSWHGMEAIVFHDGYQYFERAYGLSLHPMTGLPEHMIEGRHLAELRAMVVERNIPCVFVEPEMDARVVQSLTQGTPAKTAMLDPEAMRLTPGPELYFQLMEGLADGVGGCWAK